MDSYHAEMDELPPFEDPTQTFHAKPNREKAQEMVGRYKLLEKIGEGGFGTVWLAEQREPVRRRVALKIIKPGMDSRQIIARFEAERQALALLEHPSITKVLDAGTTERGRPYFVMEYVPGESLLKYCDRERLDTPARLDLFTQVCQAIEHAHQKGIIHRDIKPDNVMVTLIDGKPVPKVIDFGIAKATSGALTDKTLHTMQNQIIGTPVYMSPEQAEGGNLGVDTRSDVYSLGVLLYELLAGLPPFDPRTIMSAGYVAMVHKLRTTEPPAPSRRLETEEDERKVTAIAERRRSTSRQLPLVLRGDLDWIVLKCLEKERDRRYGSASDLVQDLERHLTNEPIQAAPPSVGYRLGKFVQRNRVAVALSSLLLAAILTGIAASIWFATKAEADRRTAVAANRKSSRILAMTIESQALASMKDGKTATGLHRACPSVARSFGASLMDGAPRRGGKRKRLEFALPGLERPATNSRQKPRATFLGQALHRLARALHYAETADDRDLEECIRFNIAVCLATLPQVRAIFPHPRSEVRAMALNKEESVLATGGMDGTVKLWSMPAGAPLAEQRKLPSGVLDLQWIPDSAILLALRDDGYVQLVDTDRPHTSNVTIRVRNSNYPDWMNPRLLVAPDGESFYVDRYGTIVHHLLPTGRQAQPSLPHSSDSSWSDYFYTIKGGTELIIPSSDWNIHKFDTDSGKRLTSIKVEESIKCSALFPDERHLVCGYNIGGLRLWDIERKDAVGPRLHHKGKPHCLAVDEQGKKVVCVEKRPIYPCGSILRDLLSRNRNGPRLKSAGIPELCCLAGMGIL